MSDARRKMPLLLFSVAFFALVAAANGAVRAACGARCPAMWPVSIAQARLPALPEVLLLVVAALLVALALPRLYAARYPLPAVMALGGTVLLLTTLSQGGSDGFVRPVAGCGRSCLQYYHDAIEIASPAAFVRDFVAHQPTLRVHSGAHPPGAVLLYYALTRLLPGPAWIGLALALASLLLSGPALYALLRHEVGDGAAAGAGTLLFLLLPAVQIYYASALDGLIAALLLLTLLAFRHERGWLGIVGTLVPLALAASLTFATSFVVPLLVVSAWQQRRWARLVAVLGGLALLGVAAWVLLGFDYLASFRQATALENPDGFRLLVHPASYALTRAEGLLEFALFGGPALLFAAGYGLKWLRRERPQAFWLVVAAIGTWVAMLATGAYRTGETARACLYLYPYLVLPAAVAALRDDGHAMPFLALTVAQAIVMQAVATYFW